MLVLVVVRIAEVEVLQAPWSAYLFCFGSITHYPYIAQVDAFDRSEVAGHILYRVTGGGGMGCIQLIAQQYVLVVWVVLRRAYILRIAYEQWQGHAPFFRQQLAKRQVSGHIVLVEVVLRALLHILVNIAIAGRMHTAGEVHITQVGELHGHFACRRITGLVVDTGHPQFIKPYFGTFGQAIITRCLCALFRI